MMPRKNFHLRKKTLKNKEYTQNSDVDQYLGFSVVACFYFHYSKINCFKVAIL